MTKDEVEKLPGRIDAAFGIPETANFDFDFSFSRRSGAYLIRVPGPGREDLDGREFPHTTDIVGTGISPLEALQSAYESFRVRAGKIAYEGGFTNRNRAIN